jgi:hypothetical protein
MSPHRLVRSDVFRVHTFGFFDQIVFDLDNPAGFALVELRPHTRDRPE